MQSSLVNKIKKNISLEKQIISETDYLLENVEYLDDKDFVLDKLKKIKKTAVDRKIYFIELLKLIEVVNINDLADCLKIMNDNIRDSEKELNTLRSIANSIYY